MPTVTGAWDSEEIEAFLADVVVPIRIGCTRPDDSPWMLSLWFRFEDGRFLCATGRDADVVQYLRHEPTVSFEVSTNDVPYRGVRGNGETSVSEDEGQELLRSLLERYLDGTDGSLARRLLRADREEVRIEIEPDRLHSWDYTQRMGGR